jgi:hypothetical protein
MPVGGYKMPLKNIKQFPEKLEIKITNFDFFLILVVGTDWIESKIEKSLKIPESQNTVTRHVASCQIVVVSFRKNMINC